ncbi:HAMP domain-containing protein [Brevibacillus humidisoli]|uniref:ATP-binding protein n=1 Tax=Brevibacillus humidisoli TaxID=2895522 RepID=UPI001E51AAB7|nr:ATP-binding protein [Brevibacillus humidisoli]UFJ42831.1 HAMP domain-containing protein [Brevibacillus humidisoli]
MEMLFRSVVGKLWMTIIALFALVLTIFSLLIVQSFDTYYLRKQTDDLRALAERLSASLDEEQDKRQMVELATKLGSVYRTGLLVVDEQSRLITQSPDKSILPHVDADELLRHPQLPLEEALSGAHPEPTRMIFHSESSNGNDRTQILAVTVPLVIGAGQTGAIVMYQALEDFNGTVAEVRKLIFVVGVLGFISTTVFAFFLSSRITFPLRQMKQTAHRIAEGDFHAEIPIRTSDEIGELASSFNTMASRLDGLVHAVSREKEQLASVLRSMVDGVIMIDAEGRIAVTNPPAEQFLRDWEYEQNSVPSPIFSLYQRVLESEYEVTEDIPLQGRIWSVVVAPLYVKEHIGGAVAVLRDMTKERKLDKLRKDFVANVSHELRTPLSMLQGYSEAIVDDIAATPEEHKELAKIIYDESVRMTKLVNELLDLARMEAGHVELQREQVTIRPYFERIQRKFANIARERSIALQLEMKTPVEEAWFDPDRMEQVLTNLIDNALRHTPAHGTVKLSVRGEGPLIEVSDTGSGIPQEDLPFVFERFYKADKARTRGRAGTGLGLGIAKNIIEAHGGTITVHSKPGEGTTFTIKLSS